MPEGPFDRGWALMKVSIEVLRGHKTLLVYPVAGLACTVSFSLLFLGAGHWANLWSEWWIWPSIGTPVHAKRSLTWSSGGEEDSTLVQHSARAFLRMPFGRQSLKK